MKRKMLTIGIILLFVGLATNPIIGQLNNRDDTTPPLTTAIIETMNYNGWYRLPVWITLDATDNESGVNVTYYRIDNGSWVIYSHTIQIEDGDVVIVGFYSVDNSGNAETPKQLEIKIDETAPTTECYVDPPVPNGGNGWYISNVTVTLNATDTGSGVNKTYCSLLPPGEAFTEPINITEEGTISFWYYSIDHLGHRESDHFQRVQIDKTPPIIILNYTWERVGFRKYYIIVTAICVDSLSGPVKVEFYLNDILQETVTGPGPDDYVWSYEYTPGLNVTIKAIAYDVAGNVAEAELINPHNSHAQNLNQWIYKFLLFHQIINLILSKFKRVIK